MSKSKSFPEQNDKKGKKKSLRRISADIYNIRLYEFIKKVFEWHYTWRIV